MKQRRSFERNKLSQHQPVPRQAHNTQAQANHPHTLLQMQQQVGNSAVQSLIQRRPDKLINGFVFLGNTVGGGINATLRDQLIKVEAHIKAIYDALPEDHHTKYHAGGEKKTFREWTGVTSVRGWRSGSSTSKHASGSAVDINYDLQPYIATRTQVKDKTVYGGEAAGAKLQDQRKAAVEVYDRAIQFNIAGQQADVSARGSGESTTDVYQRFKQTSNALSSYFRMAFHEEPTAVLRQPIADIEGATESELLKAIPETERRAEADAISSLEWWMETDTFQASNPDWPYTSRQQYFRILRDYEHVRIPMVRGNPVARPGNTRNPARGFLDLREEIVVALVDVGNLRWGAADLGASESGDVHHFDLGNHGGVTPDGSK